MLKVKDIMSSEVFMLDVDASAEEAAWALTRRHISGAPVRDPSGALVGFLSKSDLVNPEPSQWIKAGKATVGDLMNPDVLSVYADDPALAAAQGMIDKDIHHVVVLDETSQPIGLVTSLDVVRAVVRGQDFHLGAADEL